MPVKTYSRTERIEKLKTLMEAMRTEVHVTSAQNWVHKLEEILKQRELKSLVYPPQTDLGGSLESNWENDKGGLPQLIPYQKEIEDFKGRLFTIDAGITATAGAIADPGALVHEMRLVKEEAELRLMRRAASITCAAHRRAMAHIAPSVRPPYAGTPAAATALITV